MNKKQIRNTVLLLLLAAAICVMPLLLIADSEFEGADGEAGELITQINGDYEPWFEPFWEPPGGETESLLFALQAAIGGGVLGFCLGSLRGKHKYGKAANGI